MASSFVRYRHDKSKGAGSDSEPEEVELSNADVSFVQNKTSNGHRTVIPDSDAGSENEVDDDGDQNESLIAPVKKKGTRPHVISDSESDGDSDYSEKEVMSTATRRSIYGVQPSEDNSDNESDIIQSDGEEENKSQSSSIASLSEMRPNPHIESYERPTSPSYERIDDDDDKSNQVELVNSPGSGDAVPSPQNDNNSIVDLSSSDDEADKKEKEDSSDSSVEMQESTPVQDLTQPKITKYVKDTTYPNSGVKYVKKQTKENEVNKLNGLKLDLQKVKYLLESMNISTLPDKGVKLKQRAEELSKTIKKQAEHVSNLVVDPGSDPQNDDVVCWDDIQIGTKSGKPGTKILGEHALNTLMIQRQMTLESLRLLHKSLENRPGDDVMADMPKGLKTQLMPHQLHALAWLKWRETQKPRGGILADDMGLGKTLTMISLIVDCKENNIDDKHSDDDMDEEIDGPIVKKKGLLAKGGTLVVCPASLLKQWFNEITNHCKKHVLKAQIHHGLKREVSNYKLAKNDVVITTYNLVQRELDMKGTLTRINWQRVILDEAHIVRNHKSQTARAVFQLISRMRWCLTGTPLHNKDLDLFALLRFIRCEPFDDIVVWKKWIYNKSSAGQERLFTIMKTLLLRRTKQELQERNTLQCLPQKSVEVINVELTKEETNVYQKVLVFSKTLFAQFLHQRAERNSSLSCITDRSKEPNEEYFRMHKKIAAFHGAKPVKSHEILVLLLRLRQICNHPGLIHSMLNDEEYEGKLDQSHDGIPAEPEMDLLVELAKLNIEKEGNELVDLMVEPEDDSEKQSVATAMSKVLHSSNPVFNFQKKSAKISAVLDCLKEKVFIHEGDKAVVVSQWTSMLDIVEKHLKTMGIKCNTLSGKIPVTVRHEIVHQFNNPNSEIKILLLSLCAGGVGLNLVGGNHLLMLDLHWNPQLEAQAQDRIYRVGQKKPVYIYKFICMSTIEQSISLIQKKKLDMANNVLTGSVSVQSSKLTIDDIKLMFNMT